MNQPKDHKHAAGVVCVRMTAEQVTVLYRFADKHGLTQDETMEHFMDIGMDEAMVEFGPDFGEAQR